MDMRLVGMPVGELPDERAFADSGLEQDDLSPGRSTPASRSAINRGRMQLPTPSEDPKQQEAQHGG